MTERTTFSLDKEAFNFLQAAAGNNKSAYINTLLKQEKLKQMEQAILQANEEESIDANYQNELSLWDKTLSDGLSPEC